MAGKFSLPVEKKILIHLYPYSEFFDHWEAPFETSQEGVSERLGLLLNNVSRAMGSLRDDGMLVAKLKHVKGLKRRRKVYFLTEKGRKLADDTKDSILKTRITFVDMESKARTEKVSVLVDYLGRKLRSPPGFLNVLRGFQLFEPFHCASFKTYLDSKGKEKRFAAYTGRAPILSGFLGRDDELRRIRSFLDEEGSGMVVVRGIPGIGKTSLGVRLLEDYRTKRHTFWSKVREFDTVRSVAKELSEFLVLLGKRRLNSYLKGRKDLELGRLSELLEDELRGEDSLMVFDDFQNAIEELKMLFSILADVLTRLPNLKLLILSRQAVDFYDAKDTAVRKLVREMNLEGLDPSSVRSFLESMKLDEERLDKILELTKGLPLFLELIRTVGVDAAISDLRKLVEDTILSSIGEKERLVLESMTVHRYPVHLELLLSHDIKYEALSSLVKKSILMEYPRDLFEVHDAIREHVYRLLNKEQKRRHHGRAAEIYLKACEDVSPEKGESPEEIDSSDDDESAIFMFEALHHLQAAGRWKDAFEAGLKFFPMLMEAGVKEVRELLENFKEEQLSKGQTSELLVLRGDAHALNEDWEKALKDYRSALNLKEDLKLKEDLPHLHSSIAHVQMKAKKWSGTLKSHKNALRLFKEVGDERGRGKEYVALGTSYKKMNRFQNALEMYKKGLGLLKKVKDRMGTGAALNNMAILHESMGNWGEAQRCVERSLE
ncbi:MAG: tetratricopeptide repeat protein, partial [Thermoplasmata archaeon]|nr:tetratricopeptide repeat protein [Thermoplasmata archaeon]